MLVPVQTPCPVGASIPTVWAHAAALHAMQELLTIKLSHAVEQLPLTVVWMPSYIAAAHVSLIPCASESFHTKTHPLSESAVWC